MLFIGINKILAYQYCIITGSIAHLIVIYFVGCWLVIVFYRSDFTFICLFFALELLHYVPYKLQNDHDIDAIDGRCKLDDELSLNHGNAIMNALQNGNNYVECDSTTAIVVPRTKKSSQQLAK